MEPALRLWHEASRKPMLGMMSGTSLDGLDMALCEFWKTAEGAWQFKVKATQCVPYPDHLQAQLQVMHQASAQEICEADATLGMFFGEQATILLKPFEYPEIPIASHGHTILHQPHNGFSLQIGSAAHMAAQTGQVVVSNFRMPDVALGGQGAPLVPIGDALLFGEYTACLNLGGIANISVTQSRFVHAFDVCACNMALNWLARQLGLPFDENGEWANGGEVDIQLLEQLNALPYFQHKPPKSLGREWFEAEMQPLLLASNASVQSKLTTVCKHIAMQIAKAIQQQGIQSGTMLLTGGGAWNTTLVQMIENEVSWQVVLPSEETINFKEAIVFAFIGMLRLLNLPNTLPSVTGAVNAISAGSVVLPPSFY